MTKLLVYPLRAFTIYALLLLCCSIPVYFFTIEYLWTDELDETNMIIKQRIENYYLQTKIDSSEVEQTIYNWQVVQPAIELHKLEGNAQSVKDKFYFITKEHNYAGTPETDRFRGLASVIYINGIPYELKIETNVEDSNGIFSSIGRVTIFCFILLAGGFILVHQRIAKRIWKPFYQTLQKLKQFDVTNQKEIQFDKTKIEEFAQLNKELEVLMIKSMQDYQLQKTFIENAAHEIQTPLAILRSKIDTLLQTNALTNEQAEIINSINLPLSRVSRVHKNLLLLAGLENNQFSDTETIQLNATVHENLELLNYYANEKNMHLQLIENAVIELTCNKYLCDCLINNLLINAIRYSDQGEITIEINKERFTVRNAGTKKLNEQFLFNRFANAGSGNGGTGLGLAIVKEICKRYNWQINYEFKEGQHLFEVRF